MATKEEIQAMIQEMFDGQNVIMREEMKSMNEFMTQLVKNVDKRLDEHDVMTDNKLKSFREESNQIISVKIRESEERSGFVINVLDEKVNKNKGELVDIITHGYTRSKQKIEETTNDLRASIKAIDEKTGESLTLMNRQIEINDERVENKLSKMKLNYENTRDHVVKSLGTADNNMKDFDRRLSLLLDDDIPSKVATELAPITATFDELTVGQNNLASRLVVIEYSMRDLITIKEDTPKLIDERLAAVDERIAKLEKAKPAPPAMPAIKADIPADTGRPPTPPVWRLESPMGTATARSFSLANKVSADSESNNKKSESNAKKRSPARVKKKANGEVKLHEDPDDGEPPLDEGPKDESPKSFGELNSSEEDDDEASKSVVLDSKKFKANSRRNSIVNDATMGRSSKTDGPSHQVVCIQPPPSTDGMFLEKVKLGRVLAFCKRFNAEAARFPGGLNISNYISERVLSQMKMIAVKYNMPGRNGILVNGEQRVNNTEAYAILAVMCAPRNLEEMQRQLLKTSSPLNIKHDYKDVSVIERHIGDYKTDVLIYIDRFEDKIRLLSYTQKGLNSCLRLYSRREEAILA